MLANNLKWKDYRNDYGTNKPHRQPKLPYWEHKATEPIKYTAMLANNLKWKDYRNDYGTNKPHRQPKLPYWEQPEELSSSI